MISSNELVAVTNFRGLNRGTEPHLLAREEARELFGLKPDSGALVQTPLIFQRLNSELATYGQICWIGLAKFGGTLKYLIITAEAAFSVTTDFATVVRIPLLQITAGGDKAVNQCLLLVDDYSVFNSVGSEFEVQMTGTNTFDYELSGTLSYDTTGSGTIDSSLVNTITISGFKFSLYFDVASGFGTELWQWTHKARPAATNSIQSSLNTCRFRDDIYFGCWRTREIYRFRNGGLQQVGYNDFNGRYVEMFWNHLVVGSFRRNDGNPVSEDADYTLVWSGLNNPDNLQSHSENLFTSEVDSYQFNNASFAQAQATGITGVKVWGNECYVFLPNAIYQMTYQGIQANVMFIVQISQIGCTFHNSVVRGERGLYWIGLRDFYHFDGRVPNAIGGPVQYFFDEVDLGDTRFDSVVSYYDDYNKEVIWIYDAQLVNNGGYQRKKLVYQEYSNSWYEQTLPSVATGATDIIGVTQEYNNPSRLLYGGDEYIYGDYDSSSDDIGDALDDYAYDIPDTFVVGTTELGALPPFVSYTNDTLVVGPGGTFVPGGTAGGISRVYETGDWTLDRPHQIKQISQLLMDANEAVDCFVHCRKLLSDTVDEDRWELVYAYDADYDMPVAGKAIQSGNVFRFRFVVSAKTVKFKIKTWGAVISKILGAK